MSRSTLVAVIAGNVVDSRALCEKYGHAAFTTALDDAIRSVHWDYLPEATIQHGDSFWGMLREDPAQARLVVDAISRRLYANLDDLGCPGTKARFAIWVGYVNGDHLAVGCIGLALTRAFRWARNEMRRMKTNPDALVTHREPDGFRYTFPA